MIKMTHHSTEAALGLAETLGMSPKLCLNLQATYDLAKAVEARRVVQITCSLLSLSCLNPERAVVGRVYYYMSIVIYFGSRNGLS